MVTAVDTCILIDIFEESPDYGEVSLKALRQCRREGALIACSIVWTEMSARFAREETFLTAMKKARIIFSDISDVAAVRAGRMWRKHKMNGGGRSRVAADFLIGAHALDRKARLLTRDRGFYREYFKGLTIVDPTKRR